MARMSLPPGFRFYPTDEELIMYYLKRKVLGKKLKFEAIAEINVYKYSPWDLPDKSCLKSKDLEWFFFCPISRMYARGARSSRATEKGFWKSTGKDRTILHNGRTVGMVKTLVFHQGHASKGERTDWVMHEYRISDNELSQAAYVLLKVFKKSRPGPNNGVHYGAPFNEEEWSDDEDEEEICAGTLQLSESIPISSVAINNTCTNVTSTFEYGQTSTASPLPYDNSTPTQSASLPQTVVEQHNIGCVCPTEPLSKAGPSAAMSSGNDATCTNVTSTFEYGQTSTASPLPYDNSTPTQSASLPQTVVEQTLTVFVPLSLCPKQVLLQLCLQGMMKTHLLEK